MPRALATYPWPGVWPAIWQNHSGLNRYFVFLSFLIFVLAECKNNPGKNTTGKFAIQYPDGFDSIRFPTDNHLTFERVALGKKIFFDPQFSVNGKISCGTCHKPQFAFADTVALHKGAHDSIMFRNTPSLINIGYHPYFDMDGGVPTIEMQVFVPFDGESEMNSNLLDAAEKMKKDSVYTQLSRKAYSRIPDPYVITRALGAFQRSLVSTGSRYDLYKKTGKGLDAEEKTGMELFFSEKTNCTKCHNGFLFTDFSFQDLGLPNRTQDTGRARVTMNLADAGKFKTPGLRNVALTPPYMHDGSLKTLNDVVDWYNKGGGPSANKSPWIKPLGLTVGEKKALVRFLNTLTDTIHWSK